MSKKERSSNSVRTGKTTLSIKEKLKVLDCAKGNQKDSYRTLSAKLNVGKIQTATILKHEAEIRASHATFRGNNKRAQQGRYQEINDVLYKWYSMAGRSLVPVNGPMLQEEATEIAKRLAKPEHAVFKASSRWLEKWKTVMVFLIVLLEVNLVKFRCKQLKCGWRDCLNFVKAHMARVHMEYGRVRLLFKGGKHSKLPVTVAFIVNAAVGEVTEPIVIWKSIKNTRCFKYLKTKSSSKCALL